MINPDTLVWVHKPDGTFTCERFADLIIHNPKPDIERIKLMVDLVKAQVDILKLQANDHDWACYVPDDTKKALNEALVMINTALKGLES